MKTNTIGTEIEFTGMTREDAAEVIAKYFGTTPKHEGGTYDAWAVKDDTNRTWKVVRDASIRRENGEACELVTPILTWNDLDNLLEIVAKICKAGGRVNETCGQHVHIGAAGLTATAIRNLANNMASHEDLLFKALRVPTNRKRYCRSLDDEFLSDLNQTKPATLEGIGEIWYRQPAGNFPTDHYHNSRYQTLNLHAVFTKGTVEFRIFNGELDPKRVLAAIHLAAAMVAYAKSQKRTALKRGEVENEKFTMRTWLTRMGLNGDEFKTTRLFLTRYLSGNAAWRFGIAG